MNRQEAIRVIRKSISGFIECELHDALDMAMEALEGPTPDPFTGLVNCGCGGKADCNDLGIVTKEGERLWWVECTGCGTSTHGHYQEDEAKAVWNRAMGAQP